MNYNAFGKTLLNVYNSLEDVCNRIDKMVENKAYSGAGFGYHTSHNPCDLFNSIIELSSRKVGLINLKLRIEQAISKVKPKVAKVLILRYVDRITAKQIAQLTSSSMRTVFRRLSEGVEQFCKNIKADGLNEEKVKELYKEEKWLFQISEVFSSDSKLDFINPVVEGKNIVKMATNQFLTI